MPLVLENLEKAIASLENATSVFNSAQGRPQAERDVLRAGVIQNFEFTYELCWKFMKRWLEQNVSTTVDGVTRNELFRLAAESKLIEDTERWFRYHQSRNETSHIYEREKAESVYAMAQPFFERWQTLLNGAPRAQ